MSRGDSNGPRECTENRRLLNIRRAPVAAEPKDKWVLARLYLNVQTLLLGKVHCFLPSDSGSRDLVLACPNSRHSLGPLRNRVRRGCLETLAFVVRVSFVGFSASTFDFV